MKRLHFGINADLTNTTFERAVRILEANNDWPVILHVEISNKDYATGILQRYSRYSDIILQVHPLGWGYFADWALQGTVCEVVVFEDPKRETTP